MNKTTGHPGWPQDLNEQELEQHFSMFPLAGGDGEGEESSEGGDKPKEGEDEGKKPDATFTQDEVNRMLASHKRQMQKDLESNVKNNETLKADLAASTAKFDEYMKKVEAIEAETKKKLEEEETQKLTKVQQRDVEYDARLKSIQKASDDKIEAMQSALNESKERTLRSETRRLESLKSSMVKDALVKAGSIDPATQEAMYIKRLVFNEEKDTYMFRSEPKEFEDEGQLVSVSDGISTELPAWCKKPMQVTGGSGGASANGQGQPTADDLTEAKKQLAIFKESAEKGGAASNLLMQYQVQKDKVSKLEKEVKV